MKPKAEKFRIRRSTGAGFDAGGAASAMRPTPVMPAQPPAANTASAAPMDFGAAAPMRRGNGQEDGAKTPPDTGNTQAATAADVGAPADGANAAETRGEPGAAGPTEIDAIEAEGLTGRQLRLARRMAQKHGLTVASDFDAVRQLRLRKIDPFQRVNLLELVVPDAGKKTDAASQGTNLPQPVAERGGNVPSMETVSPMERRVREVAEIQKDIARRRRKKSLFLLSRLSFFVLLPSVLCGIYFYAFATPMYSTNSAFLILKADGGAAVSPSLLGSSPLATAQDAVAVQDYLTSKDALLRLDEDLGFTSHFSQEWIDPIQRLDPQATYERAHKLYKRNIRIGFDPTEGVIRMQVTAADPETSAMFSNRLIQYAEERVDSLSQRKRENQLKDAEQTLARADAARREAQERLVRLQLENQLIDPEGEIMALRTQISTFETQLLEKRLELEALLDNTRPNQARVEGTRSDISRLEGTIDMLRLQMNTRDQTGRSLADMAAQMQLAQADLATRDLMLSEALAQLNATRREAASQVRYLTTSVLPVAPQDPTYPRKFENSAMSFLIFAGIYLMLSLTASILREQVSS